MRVARAWVLASFAWLIVSCTWHSAVLPTVSITAPRLNSAVSGSVTVSVNASDNVMVVGVQFLLDGNNLGAELTATPYSILWDSTTVANGAHTLAATARDAAGNKATSTTVSVMVSNTSTSAEADFQARCAAPGVLKCVGWDSPSDFIPASGGGGYADGLYPADDGTYQGTMDTAIKSSGAGSLKFTIRPFTGSNAAGYWMAAFGPDTNRAKFGAHSTFYVQWRQRFSPEMLNFKWNTVSNEGWKLIIMYPVPGPSCTATQLVMENTYQENIAQGYTECGARGLYTNNGKPPYLHEQGDYNCPYGGPYAGPNCFVFPANTWLTFYWQVQIGDWGQPNSYIQAWVAPEGRPLKKFLNLPNFVLNRENPGDGFNEIQLTSYLSGKNPALRNPMAHTWYDELIISRQPITAPK